MERHSAGDGCVAGYQRRLRGTDNVWDATDLSPEHWRFNPGWEFRTVYTMPISATDEVRAMRNALECIARWYDGFSDSGERDYLRGVALNALAPTAPRTPTPTTPTVAT
jgi:hypothetical protein